MHTRAITASFLLAAALLTPCVFGLTPPTDEQIAALIDKVNAVPMPTGADARNRTAIEAAMKARAEAQREGLKDIDMAEASLAQIDRLVDARTLTLGSETSELLTPRLIELAKDKGVAGARASELRVLFFKPYAPPPPGSPADAGAKAVDEWQRGMRPVLKEALAHPGAVELIKSGRGGVLFSTMGNLPAGALKADGTLEAVEPLLVPEMSLDTAASLGNLMMKLRDRDLGLDRPRLFRLLDRIAAAADGPLGRPIPPGDERKAQAVRMTSLRAKSPATRGELIGGPTPSVPFSWCNEPGLTNLTDVKGSVVVVDFWATRYDGCETQIQALGAIDARYRAAGSPVRIVGVTSIQGVHVKRSLDKAVKPVGVPCRGDAAKEMGLMPEFIRDMGITWTIAFTPDDCYNPNFGVIGIPHLALIGADGRVRENELRPYKEAGWKELVDKIDGLLREAGLKVPEQPFAMPAPVPAPASTPSSQPVPPAATTTAPPAPTAK